MAVPWSLAAGIASGARRSGSRARTCVASRIARPYIRLVRHLNGRNRTARRSVPPPKPRSPILTIGQKRRRIERLQKCIASLEAFGSEKVRKAADQIQVAITLFT
jgi:hypothetical protein